MKKLMVMTAVTLISTQVMAFEVTGKSAITEGITASYCENMKTEHGKQLELEAEFDADKAADVQCGSARRTGNFKYDSGCRTHGPFGALITLTVTAKAEYECL